VHSQRTLALLCKCRCVAACTKQLQQPRCANLLFDLHHRKSLKETSDLSKDSNSNSKGKNNGSPYEGGKDDEGNLGACDVFVAPDGEVTQVSHIFLGLVMASVIHTYISTQSWSSPVMLRMSVDADPICCSVI